MRFLNIVKDGIDNVVDENMYENVYKPAGWEIVGENDYKVETTSAPADEVIKKNLSKMKRQTPQKFNDKLIKDEDNGEV